MINPFLEPPKKPVAEPSGLSIEGAFACMTCGDVCEEAEYFPVEKTLVWVCVLGHKSSNDNFNLGV